MKNTKIEWCDSTWNPVTGCLHGCDYCYAQKMATRFGGSSAKNSSYKATPLTQDGETCIYEFNEPARKYDKRRKLVVAPFPCDFEPTFHRYRLDQPLKWKESQTIFVCSMGELFGSWVPDSWIEEVFAACKKAPQHRYLFLTKNPGRYCDLERAGIMPHDDNFWFGATFDHSNFGRKMIACDTINGRPMFFSVNGEEVHDAGDWYFPHYPEKNRFVSFEPLLYDIGKSIGDTGGDWHIIGAETGKRSGKVECKREWVEHIVKWSDEHGIPVFMKDSLIPVIGEENMRREFPWDKETKTI